MSLLPLFTRKKDSNKFLVLEIDNTQIKILAFYQESEKKLKIIGSSIKPIPENTISNNHILDKETLINVIKEGVLEATGDLEETVKNVIVGIKGMQCVEITTTAKSTATHRRIIKGAELDEIYEKITKEAYTQAQKEVIKNNGDFEATLEIIMSSSVYNKVDGLFYEDPLNVEGEVVEIAVFNAFCYTKDLQDLRKVISKTGLTLLTISPIPYAMVQNIIEMEIEEITDYTLLNFGEDATEIIVVFGKGLISTKTLPIGYAHLRDGLGYKMGLTKKEAEKVLETYSRGQLKETEEGIVQKCLDDILDIWLEGIKICFEDFTDIKRFANTVYLTGEGTLIPDVINTLKSRPWYKEITFKSIPEYKKLDINDFTRIDDATGKINSPMWIPIQSLGIAYLELNKQDD